MWGRKRILQSHLSLLPSPLHGVSIPPANIRHADCSRSALDHGVVTRWSRTPMGTHPEDERWGRASSSSAHLLYVPQKSR